jgi:hypothetical protein
MRYLRTALVAAVLTAAFVVPSNASAQITTFQIGTSAQLGPEGITVAVPVLVNCDAGFQANLTVAVAQATGKRITRGQDSRFFESGQLCTGTNQTLTVPVFTGEFPYKQGSANVSGSLFVNTPVPGGEFAFATVEPQELRIRK